MEEVRTIDSKSCKEIYVILNRLGLFYKLPIELKEYIIQNQDLSYEYDFNIDLPLVYQVDNENTKAYISYLYLKYINDSDNEKNILLRKYEKNEKIYQEKLMEKYNSNNIFRNKRLETVENTPNTIAIVEYKESIIRKFVNKIKSIFSRK